MWRLLGTLLRCLPYFPLQTPKPPICPELPLAFSSIYPSLSSQTLHPYSPQTPKPANLPSGATITCLFPSSCYHAEYVICSHVMPILTHQMPILTHAST